MPAPLGAYATLDLIDLAHLRLVLAILERARKDLTSTSPGIYRRAVRFVEGDGAAFWCEVLQMNHEKFVEGCECLMTRS